MNEYILLIEDDPGMLAMTKLLLETKNYKVTSTNTVEEALDLIRQKLPDLVISDIQLPGLSGIKLCEILKSGTRTQSLPILLLTVLGKNFDKVQGLKLGADDYLTKPYSPDELLARVEALFRRMHYAGALQTNFTFRDLTVDVAHREVILKGKRLDLRRKEFEILALLIQKRGHMVSRDGLTQAIWKEESIVTSNTLTVHIKNLREKLGPYKDLIMTVTGEGYRLNEEFDQ